MFQVGLKTIGQNTIIPDRDFVQLLEDKGYQAKDLQKLMALLTKKSAQGSGISLFLLYQYKKKWDEKQQRDFNSASSKGLGRFDQDVIEKMNRISRWMQANNYTTKYMHEQLDTNNDDQVDPQEFVKGISQLCIPGLQAKDLVRIFDAIDVNNNRYLSVNEFSLYLDGAKEGIEERIRSLPDNIIREIESEIM